MGQNDFLNRFDPFHRLATRRNYHREVIDNLSDEACGQIVRNLVADATDLRKRHIAHKRLFLSRSSTGIALQAIPLYLPTVKKRHNPLFCKGL